MTLGKLIGKLFSFCPTFRYILLLKTQKTTRNEFAGPVMGTIFLVSPSAGKKNLVIQCSPCYSVICLVDKPFTRSFNYSALLPHPLPHSGSILH